MPLDDETTTPAAADDPNGDIDPVPLNKIERSGATLLGLLAAIAGAWAVFATENQAGSAVLILVGAAFCLMGLQGTPLIRLGSGDNSLELERRRKRRQVEIAVRAAESTQELEAIVEGASILDPRLVDTLSWQASIYETRIILALKSVSAVVTRQDFDIAGADLTLHWNPEGVRGQFSGFGESPPGRTIDIALKYLGEGQKLRSAEGVRIGPAARSIVPVIVVTNVPISATFTQKIANGEIEVAGAVTWNDENDNPDLVQAIKRASDLSE